MSAKDLDIERPTDLLAYLRQTNRIAPNDNPTITTLAGGVSNRTVLVMLNPFEGWVIKQALAKLRVAVDWFSDPARINREALGLKYLAQLAPAGSITPLIFEDPAHHLLAMQAVPLPHENWKTMLLTGAVQMRHVTEFAQLLGTIHRQGWQHRSELAQVFGDRSFFESLRVEPYYLYTARQIPQAAAFLKELVLETRLRQLTLVHGDYSPKNILVRPENLILLDHEVIHFGDPAFDLGFSLTHFLSKGHHLRSHRQTFASAAGIYWREYRRTLGDVRWLTDLEEFAIRHTLGCLLARVDGRSPLEYLTPPQRDWQRASVLAMMQDLPTTVEELIETFLHRE